jgi:ATP-dependent Clp endopeptidase proteolytic subunit ClpP|tara:strand:+ start:50830 stop:51507 length:678 start_codon:yes stop_codon:yes gene_type:complete
MNFIKQKIKDLIHEIMSDLDPAKATSAQEEQKISIVSASDLLGDLKVGDDSVYRIGLFSDLDQEKTADIIYSFMQYMHTEDSKDDEIKPIEFHISTYGGCADDMFAIYDLMKKIQTSSQEVHTTGWGKVMSAGVLLLASGTKGQRKIGRNCRVMIHAVNAGNHGALHDLVNEMEAIQNIQEMYIEALVSETNMTKTQLKKLIEKKVNVYLSAQEAVDLGIADIII